MIKVNFTLFRKIWFLLTQNYLTRAFTSFSSVQIIGTLVGLLVLSLYTRHLSPEDYGKITFIMIFVIIASIVIDSGLNTAFSIRFYKVSEEENKKNIYTVLIYNFIVLLVFCSVFLLFPGLFEKLLKVKISFHQKLLIFYLILTSIAGRFYTNLLLISKKPKSYFIVNSYFFLAVIAMSFVFLVVWEKGYFSYIYAYAIAHSVLAIAGMFYFLTAYKPKIAGVFSKKNLISILKLGFPLVPNSLLLMLLTYADRYILEKYMDLAAVGIYSVGYVFADKVSTIVINPAGQALTPVSFQTFARSVSEYTVLLKKIFESYWLMIGIFLALYFSVLREIFELIVGTKYVEGYNIIPIVIAGTIFWGAANMIGGTVVIKEKTDKVFLFSLLAVVLNIALNFLLIPAYGIYGAALATFVSYVIYFLLFFSYTQKLVYVPYNIKLIVSSGLISLFFLIVIISISYLQINVWCRLLGKIICALLFILIMQKLFNVKNVIKDILQYGQQK
ncbi:MAG: oligosaccharide flippase family protein [Candidatus Omnitrophica bacterium]|nr:oligosaccharide flippase family protein [Candidatus Omnitrophota bacterium]